MILDDETEPPTKPHAAPPIPDDYALIRPILDQRLGPVVDAMTRSGMPPDEIVEVIARDHHATISVLSIERYTHHIKAVRESSPSQATNAYLDAAIQERHEELVKEAPEDLRRIDTAINFLDQVIQGNADFIGPRAETTITDTGKVALLSGVPDAIVLKERVNSAKAIGPLIALKYRLTGKRIDGEREQTAQETLEESLKVVYGPTAKKLGS